MLHPRIHAYKTPLKTMLHQIIHAFKTPLKTMLHPAASIILLNEKIILTLRQLGGNKKISYKLGDAVDPKILRTIILI